VTIGTACHSQGVGPFACAQAGCQDCLETLLQENKGLIQSVIQTQGMGGSIMRIWSMRDASDCGLRSCIMIPHSGMSFQPMLDGHPVQALACPFLCGSDRG
jgi:hypothetical protein